MAESLRELIEAGTLEVGTRLPTVRAVAAEPDDLGAGIP